MVTSLVHRYAVNRVHRYLESVFGSVFWQVKNRYAYRIKYKLYDVIEPRLQYK